MTRSMLVPIALLVGCAAPQSSPAVAENAAVVHTESSTDDTSGWTSSRSAGDMPTALYDDSGRPLQGNSVTFDAAPQDRFVSQTIGTTEPPPPPRPPRVGKRNIVLRSARLDNAMRMLAKVGNFNLVVQGDVTDEVTVALYGVEPYDAALAIAEANKLSLRYRDGIVVVGRPGK